MSTRQCDRDRAVVGAVNVGVYFGFLEALYEFVCDEEIIETPTDVPIAGMGLHIPEGVGLFRLRMKMPE